MVRVRFYTAKESFVRTFPRMILKEVRKTAKGINPKIKRVEYARKKLKKVV
jgi:hypothetical protein